MLLRPHRERITWEENQPGWGLSCFPESKSMVIVLAGGWAMPGYPDPHPAPPFHRGWPPPALTSLHWATVRSPSTVSTMQSATAAVTDSLISLGVGRGASGPAPTAPAHYGARPCWESLAGEMDTQPWHPEGHPGHIPGSDLLGACCRSRCWLGRC